MGGDGAMQEITSDAKAGEVSTEAVRPVSRPALVSTCRSRASGWTPT